MKADGVIICGLPCSGNELVRDLIVHNCGFSRQRARVGHLGESRRWDQIRQLGAENICAIVMLRDVEANEKSQRRRFAEGRLYGAETIEEQHAKHWRPTLIQAAGIATLPVIYEDLVADPERWGRRIIEFLGHEWRGWHTKVYDGNEKYRHDQTHVSL